MVRNEHVEELAGSLARAYVAMGDLDRAFTFLEREIEAALLEGLSAEDRAAIRRLARLLRERSAAVLAETRDWREFRPGGAKHA